MHLFSFVTFYENVFIKFVNIFTSKLFWYELNISGWVWHLISYKESESAWSGLRKIYIISLLVHAITYSHIKTRINIIYFKLGKRFFFLLCMSSIENNFFKKCLDKFFAVYKELWKKIIKLESKNIKNLICIILFKAATPWNFL